MHERRPRSARCCACCGSRFSASSSSPSEPDSRSLSYLAHEMVQARLERMISGSRAQCRQMVVLVATDRSSCDPRTDFRDSMIEVIESKGMKEPKELRTLLNCYLSLNSRDHRQVILEAFHEACTSLFPV